MKLARSVERRLERMVEGLASRLFPGRVAPDELATRLIREADLAITDGPAGPVAPNVFGVRIHPADLGAEEAPGDFTSELSGLVEQLAAERGWRLEGRSVVSLVVDPAMARGAVNVAASVARTEMEPWARLAPRVAGDSHVIRHNRVLIGREDGADIRIADAEVSRRHAILWREATGVWIADLGSANGTYVNGAAVADPVGLSPGDALTFGPVSFTFLPA